MFGRENYKYAAQLRAEELAENAGRDFFSLSSEQQSSLYQRGMESYVEDKMHEADLMCDDLESPSSDELEGGDGIG